MPRISPTAEGFRAAWRRPSLAFAEIAWRWIAGATALTLALFGLREYLSTLPVSSADLLFLRSGQPALVGQAVAHILRGSLQRVVMSALVAWLAVTVLWIITASAGRMVTVRALLDYFRSEKFSAAHELARSPQPDQRGRLGSVMGLSFLRAANGLAALVGGIVGASVIAGRVTSAAEPHPGLAFLLFAAVGVVVAGVWLALNWILSLAGVFAVRDSADTFHALSSAVALCRERMGAVAAVSTWLGLAHLVLFSIASSVVAFPLSVAQIVPGRIVLLAVALISLAYFALVDWLYVARLAGYVCIAEMPEAVECALSAPAPQPTMVRTAIDQEERILSDFGCADSF
jgi:hypothetical protein